ncbi:MAG: hypothetical protein ACR2P3_01190 [Geminicoccaceae bacterium]
MESLDKATIQGTGASGQPRGIMVDAAVRAKAVNARTSYEPFREATVQMTLDDETRALDGINILARPEILKRAVAIR